METQLKPVEAPSVLDLKLREEFEFGVKKFENNPLHLKLRSSVTIQEKLKFVPRMLFFVMGFKDLMSLVRYENASDDQERSVNIHSDEDSNHWQWYLNDLEFISAEFKYATSTPLISDIWSENSLSTRETIYKFAQQIYNCAHPAARMLMIEVLELTFDKFKAAIHPVLKETDLYDRMDYFGKTHQDTEENHTTGISEDEIAGLISKLPEEIKTDMIVVVHGLFDQMYRMASNWAKA